MRALEGGKEGIFVIKKTKLSSSEGRVGIFRLAAL